MLPDQSHQSPARALPGGCFAQNLSALRTLQRATLQMLLRWCTAQRDRIQEQQRLCPGQNLQMLRVLQGFQ